MQRYKKKPVYNTIAYSDSSGFPGYYMLNSAFACIVFDVIFVMILTVLCYPLFWQIIGEYIMILLAVVICAVLGAAIFIILMNFIYSEQLSGNARATGHVFEAVMFFSAMIGGAAASFGRILTGISVLVLSMIRMDKPMLPKWILNMMYIDFPNKSYLALVKVYADHNNPVAVTFEQELLHNQSKTSRPQNKFRFLWLYRNASLCRKYRVYSKEKTDNNIKKV